VSHPQPPAQSYGAATPAAPPAYGPPPGWGQQPVPQFTGQPPQAYAGQPYPEQPYPVQYPAAPAQPGPVLGPPVQRPIRQFPGEPQYDHFGRRRGELRDS
jgi:hypothetical protein